MAEKETWEQIPRPDSTLGELAFELCPVYACVLSADEHNPVDPAAGFDCEPESYMHGDGEGGYWPAPFYSTSEPLQPASSLYGPYEQKFQEEERARMLHWASQFWHCALEDIEFECFMLGSPTVFSGDLRPQPGSKLPSPRPLPDREETDSNDS